MYLSFQTANIEKLKLELPMQFTQFIILFYSFFPVNFSIITRNTIFEAVLLYIYSDSNYKECIFRCYVIEKKFYIINILNFSTYYEKR